MYVSISTNYVTEMPGSLNKRTVSATWWKS